MHFLLAIVRSWNLNRYAIVTEQHCGWYHCVSFYNSNWTRFLFCSAWDLFNHSATLDYNIERFHGEWKLVQSLRWGIILSRSLTESFYPTMMARPLRSNSHGECGTWVHIACLAARIYCTIREYTGASTKEERTDSERSNDGRRDDSCTHYLQFAINLISLMVNRSWQDLAIERCTPCKRNV